MKIERRKIAELKNDPANARKHSPRNLKAIRDSLDVFGQQKPIVIDSRGVVIAGNGTLEAARELGWDDIAVAVTDLDPAHAQAFGIADNRTAELAEWDTDILGQLLEGMDSDLADILSIDDLELPDSIDGGEQGEGLTDPDEVPEPPEEPITQTGDLWLLGEHRLLCGDSTKAEDVGRLMDGAKADMVFTDPPYGVTKNEWDRKLTQEDLNLFLEISKGPVCVWNATRPDIFKHVLSLSPMCERIAVWRMTAGIGITGKGGMFWTWQPIFVWRAKEIKLWDSVEFESDKPTRTGDHPTQKPVKLVCKWLSSSDVKSVADPFLGSGTTLIAAEQLGRKCYGMEIDPKYCDVIVKRWEDFTGQTATRETVSQMATRENERT